MMSTQTKPTNRTASSASPPTLRFVVFRSDRWWVAIGLDSYLACQAETLERLAHEIERQIVGHGLLAEQTGTEMFAGLGRAPEKYWRMYEAAERLWSLPAQHEPREGLPTAEIGLFLPAAA